MLLAYKKRLLPILNGPLPPDRLIVPSSNDNGNISVFKNTIGCADLELALMRKKGRAINVCVATAGVSRIF